MEKPAPSSDHNGAVSDNPTTPLRAYLFIVAVAAFATTFAQLRIVGNLPLLFLLKEKLHFEKEQVSEFFLWATFAWNLKPLAGVLTDAFPIFHSRRRLYMIFGSAGAAACWIGLGVFHQTYGALLVLSIFLNIAVVFASTAMGGLQVEAGQAYSVPGRVSSLRQVVSSVSQIAGPFVGGILADRAFGYTAGIGAATLLALALVTITLFKERPSPPAPVVSEEDYARPTYRPSVGIVIGMVAVGVIAAAFILNGEMANVGYSLAGQLGVFLLVLGLATLRTRNAVLFKAQGQLSQIMVSRTLWMAVGMLFLVYTVPGLYTALTYRQSDDLGFSKELIGDLTSLEGVMGVLAAFAYAAICTRFNLRVLLFSGIALSGLATLLYLGYARETAPFIHAVGGFTSVIAELALMDLAVRSTPKGCEALGFSLMMSVRNFGIAVSDVIGSKMMDQFHVPFNTLVLINAATTGVILLFIPLLPRALMLRKEGEKA